MVRGRCLAAEAEAAVAHVAALAVAPADAPVAVAAAATAWRSYRSAAGRLPAPRSRRGVRPPTSPEDRRPPGCQ
eukprot:365840-Chlamydomonas_euryale.AAC.4